MDVVAWQTLTAATLLASGAPLLIAGLWREWDGLWRPPRDPAKVLTWVRGFRLSMIGAEGDLRVFWSNGLVGSITTLALVLLFWPVISHWVGKAAGWARPAKAA